MHVRHKIVITTLGKADLNQFLVLLSFVELVSSLIGGFSVICLPHVKTSFAYILL